MVAPRPLQRCQDPFGLAAGSHQLAVRFLASGGLGPRRYLPLVLFGRAKHCERGPVVPVRRVYLGESLSHPMDPAAVFAENIGARHMGVPIPNW